MNRPITPTPELVEEWIAQVWHEGTSVRVGASDIHIAAMRPNPLSLKEQALAALNVIEDKMLGPTTEENLIRRALESLDD